MRIIICLILTICLVSICSGLTMSGDIRFNRSVEAGQSYGFETQITSGNNENGISFDVISQCPFVTTEPAHVILSKEPVILKTTINVPIDVQNSNKRCDITLTPARTAGEIIFAVSVPISLNIHNGTLEPTLAPTVAPTKIIKLSSTNNTNITPPPSSSVPKIYGVVFALLSVIGMVIIAVYLKSKMSKNKNNS